MKKNLALLIAAVAVGYAGTALAQNNFGAGIAAQQASGAAGALALPNGALLNGVLPNGAAFGAPQFQVNGQQVGYQYIQQPTQQVGYRYVTRPVQQVQYRYIQQPTQVRYRYIQQPGYVRYTGLTSGQAGYQTWNYAGGNYKTSNYDTCAKQCADACSKNVSYYKHCYSSCSSLGQYYANNGSAQQWQQSVGPNFGQIYTQSYLQPQVQAGSIQYQNQSSIPANWWFQQPQAGQWFSSPNAAIQAGGGTVPAVGNTVVGSNSFSLPNLTGQN